MSYALESHALEQLFNNARTFSYWQDKPVSNDLLIQLYDLVKLCPTSANSCPARFVFVNTPEGKAKLKPCLDAGNIDKTMNAPVTVIIGMDLEFYEKFPVLFPHADARSWFVGNVEKIQQSAMRDSSLQGAYLIMAARSLGLDCGPMGGFNTKLVDEAFFAGTSIRSNFLCNLGFGDTSKLHPRLPRLSFEETSRFA